MTGFDSDDPTDRAARDAAAVFTANRSRCAPPSIGPTTTTTRDHDGTATPRARPFADVSPHRRARRRGGAMVGVHDARAPPPPSRRALGRRERLLESRHLVRPHLAETRRAMPAPNPRVVEPTPPLPALPLGASIVPIAQLAHIGACASDLRTLWSRSRARVQKPRATPTTNSRPRDADAAVLSGPTIPPSTRTSPTTDADPIPDASIVSVAPVAPVPRRASRRARGPARAGWSPSTSALRRRLRGFSPTRGRHRVDARRVPRPSRRARARSSRRRHRVASSSRRRRGGGGVFRGFGRGPDEPKTAIPMAEPADASDPAPPPARKGGFDAVGAVVAVSPAITLRGEDGAAPARFFMAELARCPRCGRGPRTASDRRASNHVQGESSATWRPFLGAATGGEFGDLSRAPRPEYRAGPRAGACG